MWKGGSKQQLMTPDWGSEKNIACNKCYYTLYRMDPQKESDADGDADGDGDC